MRRTHTFLKLNAPLPVALALIGLCVPAFGQTFVITEITPLPGHTTSVATSVNSHGTVVGYSFLSGANPNDYAAIRGFRWLAGTSTAIALLGGKDGNVATGINNLDEAVGYAFNLSGSSFVNLRGFIDLPVAHYGLASLTNDLGHLGGGDTSAYGINDLGNVVGESTTVDGYSHAFLWLNGAFGPYPHAGMWDLLSLSGAFGTSAANAINNSNLITGGTTTSTGLYQAFLWTATAATPFVPGLNSLGALNSLADSQGSGINDAGVVAGFSYTSAADTTFKATAFDHGKLTGYSALAGGTYGGAHAVNSYGQIVGYSDHTLSATEGTRAVIVSNGTQYDLNTLIASGSGWKLQDALAISETGKVVGYGSLLKLDSSTPTRAFVLTPNFKLVANTGVPATIAAGTSTSTAAVNLDKAVGMAVIVNLASNHPHLHVPATVVIPAGAMTKTFTVSADAASSGPAIITASLYGVNQNSSITIQTSNLTATTLTLPNVTGTPGSTASIKATLKAGSTNLSGKTITFKVDGNVIGTAVTSTSGLATLTHPLTETAGDHPMAAEFAGDTTYAPSNAAATLSVSAPSSAITVTSVSGNAGASVTLKAILKGGSPAIPLAGRTVTFKSDGTTIETVLTDSKGTASKVHILTESGGVHSLTAEFAGDSSYSGSTATGTLTVKQIPSALTVTSVTSGPGATVPLKATLKSGTVVLSGKTITFKIAGNAVGSAVTDATGVATLSHTITEGGGTFELRADFAGDTYAPATATGTLTVKLSASTITVTSVSGNAGAIVTLKSTLKGGTPAVGLAGKTVTWKSDGVTIDTATTDTNGLASKAHTLTEPGGSHVLTAIFAGDANYATCSATGTLTVKLLPSTLAVTSITTGPGSTVPLKATLKSGATPLSGKTISFKIGVNPVGTAVTDATGLASLSHAVTEAGGTYELKAEFAGDAYAAATATGTLTVKTIDTITAPSAVSGKVGANVTLKATVKAGSTPITGVTVTLKVDGNPVGTPTTDSTGLASMSFVVPEGVGSTHSFTAAFAGNATYGASNGTAAFTIQQAATKITADAAKPTALSSFSYGAKLARTTDNSGLVGKTLSFYDGTTLLGTGVTNANGRATITWTAPPKGIKKTITVKFAAEANYGASSGTGSITGG